MGVRAKKAFETVTFDLRISYDLLAILAALRKVTRFLVKANVCVIIYLRTDVCLSWKRCYGC